MLCGSDNIPWNISWIFPTFNMNDEFIGICHEIMLCKYHLILLLMFIINTMRSLIDRFDIH